MTINIFNVGGKSSEDDKEVKKNDIFGNIQKEAIMKGIAKFGILTIVGGELNRVRPPKRNIGLVFNWFTAMAVTEAIMNLAFKDKETDEAKKDPEVVSEADAGDCECKCESFKEAMEDDLK